MTSGLHKAEEVYLCWLNAVPGIGKATCGKLLERLGSAQCVYRTDAKMIRELTESGMMTQAQAQTLMQWQSEPEKEPFLLYQRMLQSGIRCIFREHAEYPARLRMLADAPRQIYVKGALPRDDMPSVGIVGARFCSDYGRYVARQYAQELVRAGVQIISGMARGIDGIGHRAALDAGGSTFAVLGCGADVCYPPENKDIYDRLSGNSGILSEYPPHTAPCAGLFPQRNRIISGLSDILLVVEAREKSGTLITVDQALEQGKEVYAVPGKVTDALSAGCNRLIRQGAAIALSPQDLAQAVYALWQTQHERVDEWAGESDSCGEKRSAENPRIALLGRAQRSVYDLLTVEGQTLDMLMSKSKLDAGELTGALMRLCIDGLAVCEQGRYLRGHGAE